MATMRTGMPTMKNHKRGTSQLPPPPPTDVLSNMTSSAGMATAVEAVHLVDEAGVIGTGEIDDWLLLLPELINPIRASAVG